MKDYKMKVNKEFLVSGVGYWSEIDSQKTVRITYMEVPYIDEEFSFGEMRLYFDTNTWNNNFDGLIYTDNTFLAETRKYIHETFDKSINDVSYSESGMQGNNYVSFDVGKTFLKFWVDFVVKNARLTNVSETNEQ
jgi:hypothetical protein